MSHPKKVEPVADEGRLTEAEIEAAAALVLLSTPKVITQPSEDVINAIMNPHSVTLRAEEEFQNRMKASIEAAKVVLNQSKYAKYEYKEQMARNLVQYAQRPAEQRQKNNEASRKSRFRRARREFLQNQIVIQNQKVSLELENVIKTAQAVTSSLMERVKDRGCDTGVFMEFMKKMEDDCEKSLKDLNPTYSLAGVLGENDGLEDDDDDQDDDDQDDEAD
ncbi:unnamed protein product [Hermetia illucens]|uniref:BZIP domain-containing protein n=1 Tax=Hermetia illucens TaxID=343691 RepID=A0A7R8UTK3_HERIL|nr:unnamed protein product [Hermetia illucens]